VVNKAHKSVDVMCDYVGYGHYSAPRQFDLYFRKLVDMRGRGVQVRMLVYERQMAENMYANQFITSRLKEEDQWERLKAFCKENENKFYDPLWQKINECEPQVKEWIAQTQAGIHLAGRNSADLDKALDSIKKDFARVMFDRQAAFMKELLQRGIEIRQTKEKLPFFMWCEDGREAVFAFLHEAARGEREVSFRTRDSRLVADSFERKFEFLFDEADQIRLVNVAGHLEPDWLPATAATAAPAA